MASRAREHPALLPLAPPADSRQAGRRAWRFSARRLNLWLGLALLVLVLAGALLAPLLSPYAPDKIIAAQRLLAPSTAHPFGTDNFGRDLFSRVLHGARLDLLMAVSAVLLAGVPGTLLGLAAGYYRGRVDQVISRFVDVWLAVPGMLLAVVLIARLGPSLQTTAIALGVMGAPSFYRLVRGGTLSVCRTEYIEAARSLGASDARILLCHVLPNLSSSIIVLASLRLGTVLMAGGGLSFIGLGAQPPQPEWGALLAAGRDYIDTAWWMAFFPGLAITLTVMGFNLLGDGLRDWLSRERLYAD